MVNNNAAPFAPMPRVPEPPPHMSIEDFREAAGELIDLICDYYAGIEQRPVRPDTAPGDVLAQMDAAPPPFGVPFHDTLREVNNTITPNLTHWQHPGFFAYFSANASFPAILGDLLCSALGVQGMLWQTSPACTEVETRVLDWLALALGLPAPFTPTGEHPPLTDEPELAELLAVPQTPSEAAHASTGRKGEGGAGEGGGLGGGGVIMGTASEAVLTAMVAALERHRRSESASSQPVAYTSTQAHSSVLKAATISGLGRDNVRLIDTDAHLAMDAGALERAMNEDAAAGRSPVFVCATLGTTSTGAFDPLDRIGAVAAQHNAWLHVDAAWAGSAFVCPEHRAPLAGVHHATSFNFNPHKWLLTNFDCSCFWLNGPAARADLIGAMSITPEYLRNAASDAGAVIDYRDWHIPLGRRFRALKLLFVLRHYGVAGLQNHIRAHVRAAEALERVIAADERFEIACPRSLSLLCIRLAHDDAERSRTRALLDAVNAAGRVFCTHTVLPAVTGADEGDADARGQDAGTNRRGGFAIRIAIGGSTTTGQHVRELWQIITESLGALDQDVKVV
jgi:aromatic-L-amino-acid decarboxylase